MDPGKLKGPAKNYQFWLKCEKIELLKLFKDYVSASEVESLPEVCNLIKNDNGDDVANYLKEKEEAAEKLEDFIKKLRQAMKHELQRKHDQFRTLLNK